MIPEESAIGRELKVCVRCWALPNIQGELPKEYVEVTDTGIVEKKVYDLVKKAIDSWNDDETSIHIDVTIYREQR